MTTEQRLQRLQETVQRLADIEAVRDTFYDHLLSLDSRDRDALADLFSEHAVMEFRGVSPERDGSFRGRDAILRSFSSLDSIRPFLLTGHHGTNLRVAVEGDEAATIAYFFGMNETKIRAGSYEHRMRRDADRWRIEKLRITLAFQCEVMATTPYAFDNHAPTAGRRTGGRRFDAEPHNRDDK